MEWNLLEDMPDTGMIVSIVMALLLMVGAVIFIVAFHLKRKRSYFFQYHSHEIMLRTTAGGVTLYVDGRVEDELAVQNIRLCTMRAFVDGDEVKVRVDFQSFKGVHVQATADGKELMLVKVEK